MHGQLRLFEIISHSKPGQGQEEVRSKTMTASASPIVGIVESFSVGKEPYKEMLLHCLRSVGQMLGLEEQL